MTIKKENGEPVKIVGHRGIASQYFENTVASFRAAGRNQVYYGIETDVYVTTDGVWVCVHDDAPFVETSKAVYEMSYDEIKNLTLKPSVNFPFHHPGVYQIATFEEYLAICQEYGKVAVIELKQKGLGAGVLQSLVDVINAHQMMDQVMFISFNFDEVTAIISLIPESVPVQQLIAKDTVPEVDWFIDHNYSVDVGDADAKTSAPYGIKITRELVERTHAKGLEFNVWTVDEEDRAIELGKMGVDYITTDIPLGE
jgi:glycerophosphoryl diester phosphodiesterase